ncbi:N-acetylmuramoyl-L-alanine amidase [Stenotrophomonas sp. HITSZ_GD]|uniref:N-acetylmuramoyl-L-alanine amidase n=1 Tax=Stenotrophomonas sp. HITSZ_GD TaxID=3037248 RepID=UPI00240E6B16|nr:N-acetylmuramoyl-L-alanine amidase [Stenotrophomonas sp. HITSZ_GD]MDG2526226.1 N-acetylmuramoyl-L-alanine amidase [Stenotrophomonas sp. HITSZ_GD]
MSSAIRPLVVRLLVSALGLAACAHAFAGEIQAVSLSAGSTGTRAEIKLAGAGGYKTLSLAGPNRLVVDFPDSSAVRGLKLPAAAGVVTAVRTGQPEPGTFRVVFDLANQVSAFKPQLDKGNGDARLVIEWPGEYAASAPAPATPAVAAAPSAAPSPSTPPAAAPAPSAQARDDAARATAALTAAVVQKANGPTPEPVPAQPAAANPAAAAPLAYPRVVVAGAAQVPPVASAPNTSPQAILNGAAVPVAVVGAAAATPAAATPVVAAPATAIAASAALSPGENAAEPPRPVMPSDASRIKMKAGMRPLVVAIDPGHGGQDPGAIGPTGKREKDVTLAVARELARQVNATPGLKAYLTRDTDVFIPLPMRAKKARAAGADIFISIHADAAENRSASGSSVYVLSTKGASSQRARWLADKENAADLVGGVRLQQTENTLANVLLDLAQSGHMKASEDAAGHVLSGLKDIGNNHKPSLERANFAVLRTSDMPAMLVETAFISNPDEERRLTDPSYQRKLAGAVLEGVNTFFTRQPPPGTLYAARAQAEMEAAAGTVAGGSR